MRDDVAAHPIHLTSRFQYLTWQRILQRDHLVSHIPKTKPHIFFLLLKRMLTFVIKHLFVMDFQAFVIFISIGHLGFGMREINFDFVINICLLSIVKRL